MATESPMRMVETSGAGKWASSKDPASLASTSNNVAEDELVLLLRGHRFHGDQTNKVINRSGSAPPSMEGSFVAFRNLIAQQNASLESVKSAFGNYQSEGQLSTNQSNLSYYLSNLNLNPRLPPPIISRENRRLVHQVGPLRNSWKITSIDDSVDGSLHLYRGSLSTHDEEPELDGSPLKASNDWAGSSNAFIPGQDTIYSLGRHKSLVDLIQEDFPRTPSPVYNQSHSSSHAATEEQIGHNILSHNDTKSPESNSGSVIHGDIAKTHGIRGNDKSSVAPLPKNFNLDKRDGLSTTPIVEIVNKDADKAGDVLIGGATVSDASRSLFTGEDNRNKQDGKNTQRQIHHPIPQQNSSNQVHGSQTQVIARALNLTRNAMDRAPRGQSKLPSSEAQPVMQPPELSPPLYATAAAYITSGNLFFPNLYPPGLYAPQYGFGGYALSSAFLPPFMAGYPPHTGMPVHFDANSSQSFNARSAGVSTGDNAHHTGDLQHLNKFPGQQGLMVHPPFVDPLQMQYIQHPAEDGYGTPRQYSRVPTTGVIGAQVDSFALQKESNVGVYVFDQKIQLSPNGSMGITGPRNGGFPGSYYYGSPQNLNVVSQFSASPLGSPVPPGSPVGGANFSGSRKEMRFPQVPIRNAGMYPAWQGQRGFDSFNDPKKHSLLEELKSSSTRKFGLSDITGRVVEFSVDQHGSRFIQQKLENCSDEEKATVFNEVLPHASRLITDVFGNYVIQKFFEHGSTEQRRELANQLSGQMLPLSLQMYGCRVIQKALEVIELDQKVQLVHELDGNVMRCVQDQNGNHVIQKCIECIPAEKIGFIISAFQGQVATLSTHPYGCRVIQRVLEHCSDESHSQCIVDEILESAYVLAQDQYGNYVTQHVLERGKRDERSLIIRKLAGKIVQMSQQKYASNVVEKCLEHGDPAERELLIEEILQQPEENDHLLTMMKDQFANYVVQKILEISSDKQQEVLLNRISIHLHALKKYTYGKHIVARFEQLCGEEKEALES